MTFIKANLGTIIVSIILIIVIAMVIRAIIKSRKNGNSCCGDCTSCQCKCDKKK